MDVLTPAAIREGGLALAVAVLVVVVVYLWRENKALWERHTGKAENMAEKVFSTAEALRNFTERLERLEEMHARILEALQRRRGGG